MYSSHTRLTRQSQIEHPSIRTQYWLNARLQGSAHGLYYCPSDGVVCAARELPAEENTYCRSQSSCYASYEEQHVLQYSELASLYVARFF
jgi:hypothetical protein